MLAPKLKHGDHIRVVSPSRSLAMIAAEQRPISIERLAQLGLTVSFSAHAEEQDEWNSSPIASRVADLLDAFRDPSVNGILTTIGGYNSNQLLRYLDYDLIRANPKVFCGYSDITALATAIHAKTGLVTYSGPHFTSLAMQKGLEYTLEQFAHCVMDDGPFAVPPADHWSDDAWYMDQENRVLVPNAGYKVIHEGRAEGTILGGNLGTLALLFGTEYMPSIAGTLLLIEDDLEAKAVTFDRVLQALIHQPGFGGVQGILIGRFQRGSETSHEKLLSIIGSKRELDHLPIVADASFGHTTPQFTFPIGGRGTLVAENGEVTFTITEH
jgi:muramoyltetrapeptide carboxypeptidase